MRGAEHAVLLLSVLTPSVALAYGEPVDGVPNRYERLLHVLTNQVRQAPHDWPGWDTSLATAAARSPVAHESGLSAAARFHADDMATNMCFQHESCDGTPFQTRVSRYFSGAGSGENIYSALGDRSAYTAITSWMNSDGHRTNMLLGGWTHLGTGFSERSNQIYYVQDFGETNRAPVPPIPAAAFFADGQELVLLANYWDPEGRRPVSFDAVLDGAAHEMERIAGPDGNETLSVRVDRPEDCTPVYYVAIGDDGDETTYPTEGSLLVGKGCTEEYVADRTDGGDDRVVIDADDPETGCTASGTGRRGMTAPLFLLGLLFLARRR